MDGDIIDSDISRWILEFLLRQPLEDDVLDSLIRVIPLPNDNLNLKKSFILRKIESEVSNGVVSEKILSLLEQIEELDSLEASDALKAAYCAVAVDCTVRFLKNGKNNSNGVVKGEYFDAVKRIWRGRVSKMEKFGNVGLVSDDLMEWKDEIEAALWEESVCENVVKRSEGIDAVEAVRAYVNEEKGKTGPPFLEFVAEMVKSKGDSGDVVWELIGLGKSENSDRAPGKAAALSSGGTVMADANDSRVGHEGNVLTRRKHVAHKRTRGVVSGASRGAKIADVDEVEVGPSCSKYDTLATPEVNKVQETLKSSRLELKAVVKDPLPDALRLADNVISSFACENRDQEPVREDQNRVNPPVTQNGEVAQSSGGDTGNGCSSHQTNAPKLSLMERNNTAHTFQWDDSLGGSQESPNRQSRPQLPSPRRRPVSPLKKYEVKKLMKRRKIKRWSTIEEDTLRTGVEKFGKGNWKLILNAYRDIFEERTEVDLKDKWRNMTRCG